MTQEQSRQPPSADFPEADFWGPSEIPPVRLPHVSGVMPLYNGQISIWTFFSRKICVRSDA